MAFNKIWEEHQLHVQNFIKTKVDDEHSVDDILQEVSIKLFNTLHQKTSIKNYKAWLFQVARNTIADHYRKNKQQADLSIYLSEPTSDASSCVCDLSAFVIQKYLPEKYGKPLYLSDIEKRPQQEVAQMLNLSLTATKSRIQRARIKLKELVDDCVDVYYNDKGQVSDFQLKKSCELPQELKDEMEKLNLMP